MNSGLGFFGGVQNLDVLNVMGNSVKTLKVGDLVDFRAIRPIANAIRKGN